jgi:hypothetical protein
MQRTDLAHPADRAQASARADLALFAALSSCAALAMLARWVLA